MGKRVRMQPISSLMGVQPIAPGALTRTAAPQPAIPFKQVLADSIARLNALQQSAAEATLAPSQSQTAKPLTIGTANMQGSHASRIEAEQAASTIARATAAMHQAEQVRDRLIAAFDEIRHMQF